MGTTQSDESKPGSTSYPARGRNDSTSKPIPSKENPGPAEGKPDRNSPFALSVSPPPSSLTDRVRSILDEGGTRDPAGPESNDGRPVPPPLPEPPQEELETVPTAFRWVHGGNEVYVTGSFNNWQGKIMLQRIPDHANTPRAGSATGHPRRLSREGSGLSSDNGPGTTTRVRRSSSGEDGELPSTPSSHNAGAGSSEFMLVIDIPPGIHQYKYIVDEEWRLDPDGPTTNQQGVINNLIEVKRSVFENTRVPFVDSDDEEVDEFKQKILYGQKVPAADDYSTEPPKVPPHLETILLNTSPDPLNPFSLPIPTHVVVHHLYVRGLSSKDTTTDRVEEADVWVTGITQRFKTKAFASMGPKFVTTVYYAPRSHQPTDGSSSSSRSRTASVIHAGSSSSTAATSSLSFKS